MRSRLAVHAARAAMIAVAVLVLGSAPAAADGKRKHDTLRLVGTPSQSAFLDRDAPGPSLGDEFVFSNVLRKDGRDAGTAHGVCVVTEVVPPYTAFTFQCVATLALRRGQITLQGVAELQDLVGDPGPFTWAITGGTGAYRSAGGEARVLRAPLETIYKLSLDNHGKKKHNKKKKPRGNHG